MVLVLCISRSHRLKKIVEMKTLKIFLSETTRHRALMLVCSITLMDFYYQVCTNLAHGAKMASPGRPHLFVRLIYGKTLNNLLV